MINKPIVLPRPKNFDLEQIFDCGQCFRFDKADDGNFHGVAFGKYIKLGQNEDNIFVYSSSAEDFEHIWRHFLSIDTDYNQIRSNIVNCFGGDPTITKAMEMGQGIRILRQDPWETVCSFIISQNNNIPRIKKIVASLSAEFGEKISVNGSDYYSFPDANALYKAGTEKIFALKTGFRAGYLYDAAAKVVSGELDFKMLKELPTAELIEKLMTIKGVGPKVASCAALFGFGKTDAFPVDVWVKRVIEKYYPNGLQISSLGKYAGIAQQYLFYYERYSSLNEKG